MNQIWTDQLGHIVGLIGAISFPVLIVLVLAARTLIDSSNPTLAKVSAYILVYIGRAHISKEAYAKYFR